MELKKNPNADVHQKKSTNMLIGLNAALILILGLFYYNNPPEKKVSKKKSFSNEEMEIIPPTQQEPPKAPPPPPSPEIQEIEDDSEEEETEVKANDVDEKKTVTVTAVPTDDGDGEPDIKIDNNIYTDVDIQGEFKGGEDKLLEFVRTQFRMPPAAVELGISGIIFIQFVVEKDGTISNMKAIAPPERQLGYGLEQECMRVVKMTSGKWKPAQKAGVKVRNYYRFPMEIDNSNF